MTTLGGGPTPEEGTGEFSSGPARTESRDAEPHHWRRLIAIWLIISAIGEVLWLLLVAKHVPPGQMSNTAAGASFDFNVLFVIALPVLVAVWVYMVYAIFVWRASRGGPEPVGGPAARSHLGVQAAWIVLTTAIVLFLAAFGTYELVQPGGAGGGQGPTPIWTPASHRVLPIQVIGQQWKFTFRYPTFGGFETNYLVVPINTPIAFHVTSLDVIHSFWAYQLGVKADANPNTDNVAYTTPTQLGTFTVRCAELCGLWHGAMYQLHNRVVTRQGFFVWAKATERALARNTRLLPPFSYVYVPDANGAAPGGGVYPTNVDPYSKVETYGAPQRGGIG